MLEMGFAAVGRPDCSGGGLLLADLVARQRPAEVVIVADVDPHGAGQRGAAQLAAELATYCRRVRVITPPDGMKDAREWKAAGGTAADVRQAIRAAPQFRVKFKSRFLNRKGESVERS
jgi:hypothetical protein